MNGLAAGPAVRVLTVAGEDGRGCPALEPETRLSSRRVKRVLGWIITRRGRAGAPRCENAPEFTSRHFRRGAGSTRLGRFTSSQAGRCRMG